MDVFEAIRHRRSVKPEQMKPEPVDRALIERVLEAANWAPSHGHTEPWRFQVFMGPGRASLAEIVASTAAPEGVALDDDDPRRLKVIRKMSLAPVVIAIVCSPGAGSNIVPHEEIAATSMAVQNLHLAAYGLGLAGFWTSGKKAFDPRVARFLELTEREACLGFFYLGWPAAPWPTSERGPIEDKVRWRSE